MCPNTGHKLVAEYHKRNVDMVARAYARGFVRLSEAIIECVAGGKLTPFDARVVLYVFSEHYFPSYWNGGGRACEDSIGMALGARDLRPIRRSLATLCAVGFLKKSGVDYYCATNWFGEVQL